jgi:GT2 family glycosyltransferase/glycosyltransferase involved in cell wall biosynthesis
MLRNYKKPHPLFDPNYYIDRNPTVADSGQDPLVHFLNFGGAEGKQPHPDFDAAFYLENNPDVIARGVNPLVHFLQHGAAEGRLPHPDFDETFYATANPDVAASGMRPVLHFAVRGAAEGRLARRDFIQTPDCFLPVQRGLRTPAPDREVDVIIPVYKGLAQTKACIESVLVSSCTAHFHLIVINDASPETKITHYLRGLAADKKIILTENSRNLGFVKSVNRGMQYSDHDVTLLNSDTLVFNGWLDRLAACAHATERTGTVTPFSNNATICSYPVFCADNKLSSTSDIAALDSLFASVNWGRAVEIPTGVGCCMFIRRDCLQDVGLFDAQAFGKGYGEENDFCMRAAARGWTHKLACDVFVYHSGGVSFGEPSIRQQTATKKLVERHPHYPAVVHRHIQQDPANPYRIAVTAERLRRSGKRIYLAVLHALGGGVAQHVNELIRSTADDLIWLTLKPCVADGLILECRHEEYQFTLTVNARSEYMQLVTVLRACGVERIHLHHLMGHTATPSRLIEDLRIPFDFTVHDYYTICPQMSLSDEHGRYCGEPDRKGCDRCLELRPPSDKLVDIFSWRAEHQWALTEAERVIAPSRDTAERLKRYYPEAHIIAAEHPGSPFSTIVRPEVLNDNECLRVAVLGTMAIHKGLELLKQCADLAMRSHLPLEFVLIGSVERGLECGSVTFSQTGAYTAADFGANIERIAPHIVWFPGQIPETFSYTLSKCLDLGLPVAMHEIGALPERVAGRPWSWVLPVEWSATEWIQFFLDIRRDYFLSGAQPLVSPRRSRALGDFYPSEYLKGRNSPVGKTNQQRSTSSRVITIGAAVASDASGQIQACGYVRVIQPLTHPALAETVRLSVLKPTQLVKFDADVILVQRIAIQEMETAQRIADACRRRGSRLLFEIDDNLFDMPVEHPDYENYTQHMQAAKWLAMSADAVTTSTEMLRQRMLEFNANVIVLPNYLDDRLWPAPADFRQFSSGQIRILYAGTISHCHDLELLRCAAQALRGKNIEIEVVGVVDGVTDNKWFRSIPVPHRIAASYPRFVEWIRNQNCWHWGVAPLVDNQFNRCKSALKYLEYSALGLPSVCSAGAVYSTAIRHEETGILTSNEPECWREALLRASTESELWERLRKACRTVARENAISARSEQIRSLWKAIGNGLPIKEMPASHIPDRCSIQSA